MSQIVYFKCNNTKFNLLPQSPLKSRVMSAFYIPFQQMQRHLSTILPITPHPSRDLTSSSKCNRGCSFDPIFSSNYESANLFAAVRVLPMLFRKIHMSTI